MTIIEEGNTIQVTATFYNFENTPTDPEVVKFKVYDARYKLKDEYVLTGVNRLAAGTYVYNYTPVIFGGNKLFYYEFYAEINGLPVLTRDSVQVKFNI